MKPQNLLLHKEDGRYVLKIADFGESSPLNGWEGSGFLTTYCGTPGYMAPELYRNENLEDKEAYNGEKIDIYACGIIIMEMLLGRHPF